ncbi:MAG: hypothetical protein K2W85_17555 [Phycisphaerales bacterium]|nr:hypothetical protein [Phycisphaerales bacterium]
MIVDLDQHPKIGPYVLTRDLGATVGFGRSGAVGGAGGEAAGKAGVGGTQPDRFLALHSELQTSHVAYRFAELKGRAERQRFAEAVEQAANLDHAHVLKIQQFTFDVVGHGWVITPFNGDADGVRTLSRLLREKQGQMRAEEVEHAIQQLLEASMHAHQFWTNGTGEENGPRTVSHHGAIGLDEVIVDRRGSLSVELYGLAAALGMSGRASLEVLRDEVRSIAEIAYQLITGLRAEEPLIPAERLVPKLSASWTNWLHRGLDPSGGFDTAAQALAALPSFQQESSGRERVRGMLARLRTRE